MKIESIESNYYPKKKLFFWKSLFHAIRLMLKYRRFVLIATNVENSVKGCEMETLWCGLNPTGYHAVIAETSRQQEASDNMMTQAKEILKSK